MSNFKFILLINILYQISTQCHLNNEDNYIDLKSSQNVTVTLYILDSSYQDILTIPDEYPTSYQIEKGINTECHLYNGESVIINENGTIIPKKIEKYYYPGGGSYEKGYQNPDKEIERIDISFSIGNSVIECNGENNTFYITVIVIDYATYYSEKVLNDFLEEKVNIIIDDQYEKLRIITSYISNYSYNPNIESYLLLPIYKAGNSWAAASAINYMANKAGLKSHMRYSENDEDSDIIKRSVIVKIDDNYYVSKVLYNQTSGQNYTIYTIPEGYSYYQSEEDENNIIIYQYDGNGGKINIPEKLDNKNVVGIDKRCFYNGILHSEEIIESIKIAQSIISIGDYSFARLKNIKEITIPKMVKKIGLHAFEDSYNLENISVENDNTEFCSDDGVLYNKNKTELIFYPLDKKNIFFNGLEKLEKVGNFSFYDNKYIKNVSLPKTINYIGDEAFSLSKVETIIFEGDPPVFGNNVFSCLNLTIWYPKNNNNWNESVLSKNYGGVIQWEAYGQEEKEKERDETKEEEITNNEEEPNFIIWLLIIIGIFVIMCAIGYIIFIRRKETNSTNIDTIRNESLIIGSNNSEISL